MTDTQNVDGESKRTKVMRQINLLLSKADSTTFDAERDAILAKVESLMWAHTIEEWEIEKNKPAEKRQHPEMRDVFVCGATNHLEQYLIDLTSAIARHTRNKIVFSGAQSKYVDTKAKVFGFPTDLDYFETLYASLHMQMSMKLEPRPDSQLSWVENMVMLKEAGQKWDRIHDLLKNVPGYPYKDKGPVNEGRWGVVLTNTYTRYCKESGKDRVYTNPTVYQKNFAEGFVSELNNRFYQMRVETPYEGSMALAVVDRSADIENLVKETYPRLGTMKSTKSGKFDGAAYRGGRAAGASADISTGRSMKGSTKALPE